MAGGKDGDLAALVSLTTAESRLTKESPLSMRLRASKTDINVICLRAQIIGLCVQGSVI